MILDMTKANQTLNMFYKKDTNLFIIELTEDVTKEVINYCKFTFESINSLDMYKNNSDWFIVVNIGYNDILFKYNNKEKCQNTFNYINKYFIKDRKKLYNIEKPIEFDNIGDA